MKKKIAIVAGGDSSEHGVSLRSAEGILSFIDTQRYELTLVVQQGRRMQAIVDDQPYDIDLNDFSYTRQGVRHSFDFAYITIHGTPGENGILQGYFDLIGLPYSTSGVLVEALTFNKFALNNYLRSLGIRIADSLLVRQGEAFPHPEDVAARIGLPCFIKPNAGGSSFGVSKVKTLEEVEPAIRKAMNESPEVLIESQITGTEITCGCFRTAEGEVECFPITEVVVRGVEFFDYEAKYEGKSDEITPARIAPETADRVCQLTKQIYRTMNCYGIIRIDYILSGEAGNEEINLLEINTTPGMTAASFIPQQIAASRFEIADVLSQIIEGKA